MKKVHFVYDGGSFVDGYDVEDMECAKCEAKETLYLWMTDLVFDKHFPVNIKEWTQDQIDEWDYMVDSCCCYWFEYETEEEKYQMDIDDYNFLTYEEEAEIGWLPYEELIKRF